MKRISNTNTRTLRLYAQFKSTFPFIAVSNRFSRCLDKVIVACSDRCFRIYFNRLQDTGAMELNYFVFETFYLLPFFCISESRAL